MLKSTRASLVSKQLKKKERAKLIPLYQIIAEPSTFCAIFKC